jgi:hypothetical protein
LAKCTAITRGGERCKSVAIDEKGFCYSHHPDHASARSHAARKGGKRGGRGRPRVPLTELAMLRDENALIRQKLLEGELLPGVGAVAIQSLNTDIRAIATLLKVKEQEIFESRLADLEQALERQKEKRHHYG